MNPCRKTIGWADFTWNPLVGCKTGCVYCYAKRMNDRFKWIPEWTNPVFFHERIEEPLKLETASTIFVCSMSDLFGSWVHEDWISEILSVVEVCPHHTFMFLTKYPRRYLQFDYPDNVMLGMTVTNEDDYRANIGIIKLLKPYKTFASVEPILGSFKGLNMRRQPAFPVDLIIIGAMTGPIPVIPKREWIDSFYHPNIYYKSNILKYFPDLKN